jgi:hypothetical protein
MASRALLMHARLACRALSVVARVVRCRLLRRQHSVAQKQWVTPHFD